MLYTLHILNLTDKWTHLSSVVVEGFRDTWVYKLVFCASFRTFLYFPLFEQTKEVLKTNEFGFRILMAYQTPGTGGNLITEGRESLERSPAC